MLSGAMVFLALSLFFTLVRWSILVISAARARLAVPSGAAAGCCTPTWCRSAAGDGCDACGCGQEQGRPKYVRKLHQPLGKESENGRGMQKPSATGHQADKEMK